MQQTTLKQVYETTDEELSSQYLVHKRLEKKACQVIFEFQKDKKTNILYSSTA